MANPEWVRLLDGASEIARHHRSYDRHAQIADPAHIAAVVAEKRKALGATTARRLAGAIPRIGEFLDAAFERGETVARQSKHLLQLLDDYGAAELNAAVNEALHRQTPKAASVALILQQSRRQATRQVRPVDFSAHPHLAHLEDLSVPTQPLEDYDELSADDH